MPPITRRLQLLMPHLLVLLCVGPAVGQTAVPQRPAAPAPPPAFGAFGGYGLWTLSSGDSFETLFGTSQMTGFNVGGEGRNLWKGLFVRGSYTKTSESGERVFVDDDRRVYPLGIPLTVTLQPIEISAGWRTPLARNRVSPYAGGGVLWVRYQEESDFADPDENVDETHTGFLFFGGVEVGLVRYLGVALEAQYRIIDDAIGQGGVSAVYGETSLGGVSLMVRLVVASDILYRRPTKAPSAEPSPPAPGRAPASKAGTPSTKPAVPVSEPTPAPVTPTPVPVSPAPAVTAWIPPMPISEAPPAWLPGHTAPQPVYEAELEVWIDAAGAVQQVRFLRSSHPNYDYHVRLAAMNWRYRPAMQDGKPVPSRRIVTVRIQPRA